MVRPLDAAPPRGGVVGAYNQREAGAYGACPGHGVAMFVSQAHSATQQARLAITLAWVAGYTNIIAVLTCGHVVSHVSGTVSDLGLRTTGMQWGLAGFSLFLMMAFLLGALASGLVIEVAKRRAWASIYVLPMAIEAALLTAFAILVEFHDPSVTETGWRLYAMAGVASVAMGLQNATITRISSGVVRTTHVTGVLTDLGLEISHAVAVFWAGVRRGAGPERAASKLVTGVSFARDVWRSPGAHPTSWRIVLLATILVSFALGAGLGAAAFEFATRLAMFPPVVFLLWIVYQDLRRPIAELEPSNLVGELGYGLPASLALFHLRRGGRNGRDGRAARRSTRDDHAPSKRRDPVRVQRLPNLVAWSEGLASEVRVVVLDLTDVTALNADSAGELRALLERLRSQHRSLILAGLTHSQFLQLQQAGAGELLEEGRVHADLDLALAAGLNLLLAARHHERA